MELRLLAVVVAPLSARKRLPDTPGLDRQNEKEAKCLQDTSMHDTQFFRAQVKSEYLFLLREAFIYVLAEFVR